MLSPTIRIDMTDAAITVMSAPSYITTMIVRGSATNIWQAARLIHRSDTNVAHVTTRIATEAISRIATLRTEQVEHRRETSRIASELRWRTNAMRGVTAFEPGPTTHALIAGDAGMAVHRRRPAMIHAFPQQPRPRAAQTAAPESRPRRRTPASLVMRAGGAVAVARSTDGSVTRYERHLSHTRVERVHRVTRSDRAARPEAGPNRAMPAQVWRSGPTTVGAPSEFSAMSSAPAPLAMASVARPFGSADPVRAPAPVMPDTDKLVTEVMRRIDRQVRNERFRRGLGS